MNEPIEQTGTAADPNRHDGHSPGAAMAIGERFKMSSLGTARNRRLAGRQGTIVGNSRLNRSIRVLFDGRRTPMSLHPDYIEPIG
jgi:hypothetical protein